MTDIAICMVVETGLCFHVLISGNAAFYIRFQMAFTARDVNLTVLLTVRDSEGHSQCHNCENDSDHLVLTDVRIMTRPGNVRITCWQEFNLDRLEN
jgi:hypothetical protein